MSRKPYACFVCEKNGFPNTMVYLAGKDANNKTIYLEENGSPHTHKQAKESKFAESAKKSVEQPQQQETVLSIEHIHNLLASIDGKLDRLLNLAERK